MQDDLNRLVGPEGPEVKRVVELGDQLDLEVELVLRGLPSGDPDGAAGSVIVVDHFHLVRGANICRLERFVAPPSAPSCRPITSLPRAFGNGGSSCSPTSTSRPGNGYAEGVINKVKMIKRRAYGLPSFDRFRERVLLGRACARTVVPPGDRSRKAGVEGSNPSVGLAL
jgi:hypothetical protein